MMISFAYTCDALRAGVKTVTRRQWQRSHFDKWETAWYQKRLVHKAYDRNPRNGGKHIGFLHLTHRPVMSTYGDMAAEDLAAEGGLWESVEDFMTAVGATPTTPCAVIRFQFVAKEETL